MNPVARDITGRPDAVVYWLASSDVKRVSVARDGSRSDASTYDVVIDGDCTRVAFTSDTSDLAQTTSGGNAHLNDKGVRTAPAHGTVKRDDVRTTGSGKKRDHGLVSLTHLASASDAGVPRNRGSHSPSWSLRTVAFVARKGV